MSEEIQNVLMAMNNNLHRIALSLEKVLRIVELEREAQGVDMDDDEQWHPSGYEYERGDSDDS